MGRPKPCSCCCPDHVPPETREELHRPIDGLQPLDPPNDDYDAIELLYSNRDGVIDGLTQETYTENCSAAGSAYRLQPTADDELGCVRFKLTDILPSADEFSAIQIVWTGTTFDSYKHVDHIARGFLLADASVRGGAPSSSDYHEAALDPRWGVCVRANGLLFLMNGTMFGFGVDDPFRSDIGCWHTTSTSTTIVLDGSGDWRIATTDELRAAGLLIDPLSTKPAEPYEVGVFFGLLSSPHYDAEPAESYDITADIDSLGVYAFYRIEEIVGFRDIDTLTASCPAHVGTSNIEPVELRGFTASLTLTTLPEWDFRQHPVELRAQHDEGYTYTGSTTIDGIDVTVWYTPLIRLTLGFDDGGDCRAYVPIDHHGVYTDRDPPGVSGDNSDGTATAPSFAGRVLRDVLVPGTGGTLLGVAWYGTDCLDDLNGDLNNKHGIAGTCQGVDVSEDIPVCIQGLVPNQLAWRTDCWSVDPIAIGYRRRVTDVFSAGGTMPADLCDPGPNATVHFSRLKQMGLTFSLESSLGVVTAGHFYIDITE